VYRSHHLLPERTEGRLAEGEKTLCRFFVLCYTPPIMVKLDTSVKSHRLDAEGNKQATAVDLISGETYVKVATSMPWKHPRSAKAGVHVDAEALAEKGAHQEHCSDEWFRGVWIPLENDEPVEETEPVDPDAEPTPKPSRSKRKPKR
jgi:hypothetical protein